MATDYNEQLENSIASECKLTLASGRVANFAYNDTAYACDNVAGTANYNFSQDQNIPLGNAGVLNTTTDILAKGVRSQASSLTRMMLNHFYGRTSFNVNKLADHLLSLFRTIKNFIKENDTTWSATTEYDVGDLVYFVTTLNGKKYKRTFFCIQSCLNLPPIDSNTESVINTSYWSEISGNVVSLSASESIRAKQGIIEQDLVVHGNLFVDGNTTTTTETQVATTGDYLVTRENNPSPMSSGEFSGLAVNNYDTGKMATLTADYCGEWRVSDSATVSAVTYTDISTYDGTFYDGLTRTELSSYPSHVFVNVSMLEMLDVVYYNGGYYKKEGNSWYGTVTYSNGALNKGSLITDSEIITALEALTPSSLIYYITVTDNIIDSSSNQPLLTRAESACFNNGDLLMWDSENRTAVKVPSATCDNQKLTARIDSGTGCLSYTWTDISFVDNATCFAGCTYAQACTDIRSSLVSISNISSICCIPIALCTGACTVGKSTSCSLTFTPACGVLCSTCFRGEKIITTGKDYGLLAVGYSDYGNAYGIVYVTKIFKAEQSQTTGAVISWNNGAKQCDLFKAIHCNFNLQYQGLTLSENNTVLTTIIGSVYDRESAIIKWDRCQTPLNYDILDIHGSLILTVECANTSAICGGHLFIVAHAQ